MEQLDRGNGVRLAYEVTGSGTPVVLVMGFVMRGAAWRFQVPALSARHTVCTLDNRGAGRTVAPLRPWTMGVFADDVRALLDARGWDRAHVVGVSMGGMVAQELALRAPDRLRSLTLIATHAGGARARVPPRRGLRALLQAEVARESGARHRAVARMLFPDAFLERCDRTWLEGVLHEDFGQPVPLPRQLAQYAAILRHDTRRRLSAISAPTLVVKPGEDALVPPEESERLASTIPGARLFELPDAGHGLIRQCADELNDALLEHFAITEARQI